LGGPVQFDKKGMTFSDLENVWSAIPGLNPFRNTTGMTTEEKQREALNYILLGVPAYTVFNALGIGTDFLDAAIKSPVYNAAGKATQDALLKGLEYFGATLVVAEAGVDAYFTFTDPHYSDASRWQLGVAVWGKNSAAFLGGLGGTFVGSLTGPAAPVAAPALGYGGAYAGQELGDMWFVKPLENTVPLLLGR
jgi:hypothetical protein